MAATTETVARRPPLRYETGPVVPDEYPAGIAHALLRITPEQADALLELVERPHSTCYPRCALCTIILRLRCVGPTVTNRYPEPRREVDTRV